MEQSNPPALVRLSEGLGHDAELPPWLLTLHAATLIANTHRVRVGTVQAIAKAVHTELAAERDRLLADADRARRLIQRLAIEARQSGDLLRDPEALALAAMYYGA